MKIRTKISLIVATLAVVITAIVLSVFATHVQCDDGIDNDGDGHIDWWQISPDFGDSKCSSVNDNDESPRDFCDDTDSGNQTTVQGTVSGEMNSVPFSYTDSCIDSNYLQEFVCASVDNVPPPTYNPISGGYPCSLDSKVCSGGRCV